MCQKSSILASFSEAKTTKNCEKIGLKNMFFFERRFLSFFSNFCDLGSILGGQKSSKNRKNRIKIEKNRFCYGLCFEGGFWEGFGRVLGEFWESFGRILGGFLKLLGWIWGGKQ